MPKKIDDGTSITVSLKWLISIVALLVTIGTAAGTLVYQVNELSKQVTALQAGQTKNHEDLIALTATLEGKGVLK